MLVKICPTEFDPWQELANYQAQQNALKSKYGATSVFVGTMRDYNEGEDVQGMTLEYYPGMTEKQLALIVNDAEQQWLIMDSLIIHRVGDISPNQAIVLVGIWSAHRGDAFDACRYIMENLKSKAPFWKKERLANTESRWVSSNSNGYSVKN